MKVKNASEPVTGTPKVVLNWYLRSFGSGNSVSVPSIIFSSMTTGFIRTTLLAENFFGLRNKKSIIFDEGLREAIEEIVVRGGLFFGDLQCHLLSLPIRLCGLGLLTVRDDHILRNNGVIGLDPDYQQTLERLKVSLPDFDIGACGFRG
ncbi:hypothetical protein Hanom_Chr12g01118561 [Helianthus anomalus]